MKSCGKKQREGDGVSQLPSLTSWCESSHVGRTVLANAIIAKWNKLKAYEAVVACVAEHVVGVRMLPLWFKC